MVTLVKRWLRANRDKADNLTISKGEFCHVREVNSSGYCLLTGGGVAKADNAINWSIMPENFHPDDCRDLAGRYLICVKDNNWSDKEGRPYIGGYIMITKGDLETAYNLSAKDMLGKVHEMSKDRLFGLDPEYKLMPVGFDPNKVGIRIQPLTPAECYSTPVANIEPPIHSSKWEFPKGSVVDYDGRSFRVIGRSDGFPNMFLLLSTSRGTEGTLITSDWVEHFNVDRIYVGKYGIWASKEKLSFNKDRPENKHELAKIKQTSLVDDPVTRKVKPPKFQHKRTAY